MAHVVALAEDIGPRPAGSAGDRQAMRYVRGTFESAGYEVTVDAFALPQGGRSWNVVARLPGSDPATPLILGAHLDTVRGSPGGNDNASGVAVLLELAAELRPTGVTFVAFGAEEYQPGGRHHVGSAAYVQEMTDAERDALDAMISVDMVGKRRPFIVGRLAGAPRGAARLLQQAADDAGLPARTEALGDISDHGPFALAGMPAAFLWTGDEPNHHEPTDTADEVSPAALRRAARVLRSLIAAVA